MAEQNSMGYTKDSRSQRIKFAGVWFIFLWRRETSTTNTGHKIDHYPEYDAAKEPPTPSYGYPGIVGCIKSFHKSHPID